MTKLKIRGFAGHSGCFCGYLAAKVKIQSADKIGLSASFGNKAIGKVLALLMASLIITSFT